MKRLRPLSLSQRLMLALGLVSLLFWATIAALTTLDNIDRLNELYDVHLARTAKAFLQMVDPDPNAVQTTTQVISTAEIEQLLNGASEALEPTEDAPHLPFTAVDSAANLAADRQLQYGTQLYYQLWREDGGLLVRSSDAPSALLTTQLGYSDSTNAQGVAWRHYSFHDAIHRVRVIVSEPHAFRSQLVRHIVMDATWPLALALPVLLAMLWLSIQRGLRPLQQLRNDIAQRQADNLKLLDARKAPLETKPIVAALNGLLQRLASTLEQERRFTDDAAHQLRTPLAAIQAQLYPMRHMVDAALRDQAMVRLNASVARAIRLVNQMLALARLDPQQPKTNFQRVALGDIAETACAELAPVALQRDQTLELDVQPDLPTLRGNADMLSMLISNLVDNAIHYTQRGGLIRIGLAERATGVCLEVSDNGPGVAPAERARVFERFYRVAQQNEPGTGLGLAICQRVAELHKAQITLSDGLFGSGLTVSVCFAS